MKRIYIILLLLATLPLMHCCGELDTESGREFFRQEVYIVYSEATSASERILTGLEAHTFVDTTRILDKEYNSELVLDENAGEASVLFKIGIGGSLSAHKDIEVVVGFDTAAIKSYNLLRNTMVRIPNPSEYTSSVAYDKAKGGFPVIIKKGTSTLKLKFTVPINRDEFESGVGNGEFYNNFAFALKIKEANEMISPQYHSFMLARLDVLSLKVLDWSEFPIPELKPGRYHSRALESSPIDNPGIDGLITHKFITSLEDPSIPDNEKDPNLANKYIVWGYNTWCFEVHGLHTLGWMYGLLYLNENGVYTYQPISPDDLVFKMKTFTIPNVLTPGITYDNKLDPRSDVLSLTYLNSHDNTTVVDRLTYVDDNYTFARANISVVSCHSWKQIAETNRFPYWLPLHADK